MTAGLHLPTVVGWSAALLVLGVGWQAWVAQIPGNEGHFAQWLPGYLPWFLVGVVFAAVSASLAVDPRDHLLERMGHDLVGCWILAAAVFATLVAAAITFAVESTSEPCSDSSETWIALSAPIDKALRMASVARSGPTQTTVTSASPASLICSACSTAFSLISSSTASAEARSRVLSASLSLRSE